jgi:hypothetical protein
VKFDDIEVAGEALDSFPSFPELKELSLYDARIDIVTSIGSYFRLSPKLETLTLGGSAICDENLRDISAFTSLRSLNLNCCQGVTDIGVAYLSKIPSLRELYLGGTSVSNGCIKDIGRLTDLRVLSLIGTRVDGNGIRTLPSQLRQLGSLSVDRTVVVDSDILWIGRFESLSCLGLQSTKISDECILHFANFQHRDRISSMRVEGTALTDAGVSRLRELFPNAYIWDKRMEGPLFHCRPRPVQKVDSN